MQCCHWQKDGMAASGSALMTESADTATAGSVSIEPATDSPIALYSPCTKIGKAPSGQGQRTGWINLQMARSRLIPLMKDCPVMKLARFSKMHVGGCG